MELTPDKPLAGVLAPLFALRGANDLGIGDVGALRGARGQSVNVAIFDRLDFPRRDCFPPKWNCNIHRLTPPRRPT